MLFNNFQKLFRNYFKDNLKNIAYFSCTSINSIINGKIVRKNPWVAQICVWNALGTDIVHVGCGVLIHPNWVLSAAHIFFDYKNDNVLYAPSYQYYEVFIGAYMQFGGDNIKKGFRIKEIHHPNFEVSAKNQLVFNDLALIELNRTVPGKVAQPILLPLDKNDDFSGQIGYIYGWGARKLNEESSFDLVTGRVLISKNEMSLDPLTQVDDTKIHTDIELSPSRPYDGDSGGPLTIKNVQNIDCLIGIISYSDWKRNKANVYTRVTAYLDWILKFLEPKAKQIGEK